MRSEGDDREEFATGELICARWGKDVVGERKGVDVMGGSVVCGARLSSSGITSKDFFGTEKFQHVVLGLQIFYLKGLHT